MKLTKQGVRDLNTTPQKGHVHRFAPVTRTNRGGYQVTTMECYCGASQEETPKEKRDRQLAEIDREIERQEAEAYGWGVR